MEINTINDGITKTLKIFNEYIGQQHYSLAIIVSNNHRKLFYCFITSHKKIDDIFRILLTRMCHHECTEKLNNLINNINNKPLKKICANIANCVISIRDKKIADVYMSLKENNVSIRPNTNHHFLQKHFLLRSIANINHELLKNNAKFVFGVSNKLNNYFQKKMHDHNDFMINTFTTEKVYKNMLYVNSLIKKHTLDDKLLFKLKKPNTNLHIFYLGIMS